MTILRSNQTRLPLPPEPGSGGGRVLRGLGALVATLAMVVGVPWALWTAFGAPWPSEVPTSDWFSEPLTTDVLFQVLAVVVWLAWAHFVVCIVVEFVADRQGRGLAPRIPGGGVGTQALARKLVATILLMAGTVAVAAPATAVTDAPVQSHAVAAGQPSISGGVGHARSLSASHTEVVDTTAVDRSARPAAGDLTRATRGEIRSGDQLVYYDVKPPNNRNYDTLWDIADRYLGNGLRYKEIYQLNKDVVQPDGRKLGNPDLIYPGWVMKMPSDARGAGLKVVESDREEPGQAPANGAASSAGAGADAANPSSGTAATGGDVAQSEDRADQASGGISFDLRGWSPALGVVGGLALAGLLLGLRRRRASGPGGPDDRTRMTVPDSPADLDLAPRMEAALRDEALPADASFVTTALQSLSPQALPTTTRAALSADGLVVGFKSEPEADLPAGWRPTATDRRTWMLARDARIVSGGGRSALPAMVCLGRRQDGSVLLADLESYDGAIALGGDAHTARGLAMSLAVELATHPWADERVVTLAGFADDLSALGRVRDVSDLSRVMDSLDNVAHDHRSMCRRLGVESVREARRVAPHQASVPGLEIVLCSGVPDPATLARLTGWASDPLVGIVAIVVGDTSEAAARLVLDEEGRLTSGPLGIDAVAQVLEGDAYRGLAELFSAPEKLPSLGLEDLAETLVMEDSILATGEEDPVRIWVDVLGPLDVRAEGEVDDDRRPLYSEIVTLLALHPDGLHVNVLTGAIWPRGVDAGTRDSALDGVAAWLGSDDEGVGFLTEDAGVWSLRRSALACDWDRFRAALNRASTARSRVPALRTAMALVRGPGFQGVPAGRYSWLAHLSVESDIALAIEMTAVALAEACHEAGDDSGARQALYAGLRALPANETLWCVAIRMAVRYGSRDDARTVADQMYAAVAEHGSPMGTRAQTDALVEELLPGYVRRAA